MNCDLYFNMFVGPPLPYKLKFSAMATSPDGGGVILFGGYNSDNHAYEDNLLELRCWLFYQFIVI